MQDQGSEDHIDGIFFCVGQARVHRASDVACSTDISDNKGRRGHGGRGQAERVHGQDAWRSRRSVQRAIGAHGRQARPVQGAQRAGSNDACGTGDGDECRRTLHARMAVASGGVRLSRIRACHRQVHPDARAGDGVRRADSPVYLQGAFDMVAVCWKTRRRSSRVSLRQGCRLGRSGAVPVLHDRTFLPDRAIRTTSSPPGCRRWTAS